MGTPHPTKKWLYVRLTLLVLNAIPLPFASSPLSTLLWSVIFAVLVFSTLAIPFLVGMQNFLNPYSAPRWTKPSWYENPFNFQQPIQFFHLAGFVMMVLGISQLLTSSFPDLSSPSAGVLFLAIGFGDWLGVWICVFVFRRRFSWTYDPVK